MMHTLFLIKARDCVVAAAAMLVIACADDVTRVGENSGGATTTGGSGGSATGGSGGTGGANSDVNDVSGVWDLYGSVRPSGYPVTGTLTIDANRFILTLDGSTLSYVAGTPPTVSFIRPFAQQNNIYNVTRTDVVPVDLGVVPLNLGGLWTFANPNYPGRCEAELRAGTFNGQCVDVSRAPSVLPDLNSSITAVRSTVLPSAFGELGGVWQLQSNGGQTGRCTAQFSGNELMAGCNGTGTELDATLTFTLSEGVGSGSSDEGLEISAVRR